MKSEIGKNFRLIVAILCLTCGLLLWNNLALHFAEIEDILPVLRASDLLQGKTFLIVLIFVALVFAFVVIRNFPWGKLFGGQKRPIRLGIAIPILVISFVPLFWLRFGGAAWLILGLLGTSFLLNIVGLVFISTWLAEHVRFRAPQKANFWEYINPWLPAALLFIVTVYYAYRCFGFIPHVEDSIAQLIQARIFASGHFTAATFQPREFFYFGFMVDAERWFSQYPPGHPLMLCLGVLAGIPYLVNPILGLVGVILFYYILKNAEGIPFARWGAWLMVLSPYVIFMSSGHMNHTTTLVSALVGWLGLKKGDVGKQGWLILAGLGFGYCTATRPLEGAIFALIGGIYLLYSFGGIKLSSFIKAIPYTAAFLIAVSSYAIHNWMTTGDPFLTGYNLTWGGNGLGLGEVIWGPPHTFGYGLVNTFMSISGLNVYLYEIPIPALLGVFLWAFLGQNMNRWDKAFLAAMILVPLGYLFYYFHDYCFGPRYYYVIVPMLIYFSIKGVKALYLMITDRLSYEKEKIKRVLTWMGIILLAMQVFVALPYRASVYANSYWGTNDEPMKEVKRLGLKNAIVFIENHPWETLQTKLHSLGFIMGDAHRLIFTINLPGLDEVLTEMGIDPADVWEAEVNYDELNNRIEAWNRTYLEAGNPPIDPWYVPGYSTYYSNGAVHLDPWNPEANVIFARDLGERNRKLMGRHPDRKAYRYAYDPEMRRFRLLPVEG